jgi:hypothetical protein
MFIEKYNEKLVVFVPNREQHDSGTDNVESLDSYVNNITEYILIIFINSKQCTLSDALRTQ